MSTKGISKVWESDAFSKVCSPVIHGKHVWEQHSCINCHSLHGEGAYFAPEVGNVMTRWGVLDNPEDAFETLKAWIESQPSGIEGRRQMPGYELTDEDIRGLLPLLNLGKEVAGQGGN